MDRAPCDEVRSDTACSGQAAALALFDADENLRLVSLLLETAFGLRRAMAPPLEGELGLAGQSLEILLRLQASQGGRLRMSDLALQTGLTPSGLTRAVDRLEQAELVRRESCPSDRRGSFAALTANGDAKATEERRRRERDAENLLGGILEQHEQEELVALLNKVRSRVLPMAADRDKACQASEADLPATLS